MAICKREKERCCLIGIEDDDSSLEAFDFYATHLHRPGNKVVLVHVVKPSVKSTNQLSVHLDSMREHKMMEERQTVKILQDVYEERMRHCGIPGHINVIYYSQHPGKILCEVAKEDKCSMIVIGTPKDTMLSSPVAHSLGNVIEYILKKADCPVVVYRHEAVVDLSVHHFMFNPDYRMSRAVAQQSREDRRRKISAPVMMTSPPPSYDLLRFTDGQAGSSQSQAGRFERVDSEIPPKPRRHSNIINPFLQLKLKSGKLLPETVKEDDTDEMG
jgi:nucleotide-binding universal stress UspA family protein